MTDMEKVNRGSIRYILYLSNLYLQKQNKTTNNSKWSVGTEIQATARYSLENALTRNSTSHDYLFECLNEFQVLRNP
jgi:hypothetical protein